MAYILDRVKADLLKKGYPFRSKESRTWLRKKIRGLSISNSQLITKERSRDYTVIGKMYMYFYDAKHKDKLPYWDKFPLVFPIEMYEDGFLGINLHYIDMTSRIKLLDKLFVFRTTKNLTPKTRLNLSYQALVQTVGLNMAQPCIKRYLYSHVKSKFIEVYPEEWDMAVFVPVTSFVGASNRQVHGRSRRAFNG